MNEIDRKYILSALATAEENMIRAASMFRIYHDLSALTWAQRTADDIRAQRSCVEFILEAPRGCETDPRCAEQPSHPTPASSSVQSEGASQLPRAEADGGTGTHFGYVKTNQSTNQ